LRFESNPGLYNKSICKQKSIALDKFLQIAERAKNSLAAEN
jgi:hypothetical protein